VRAAFYVLGNARKQQVGSGDRILDLSALILSDAIPEVAVDNDRQFRVRKCRLECRHCATKQSQAWRSAVGSDGQVRPVDDKVPKMQQLGRRRRLLYGLTGVDEMSFNLIDFNSALRVVTVLKELN
jgi:hypothetical protein